MSSDLRVGGLASGIDTEAMITKLTASENKKIDTKLQQKQLLEWKRSDFRDVNTKLLALRSAITDLKLDATFNAKTVSSSDEDILTATATGEAIPGTYTVKVKQVAQKVSMSSQSVLGSNADRSSIAAQFGIPTDAKINFTLAGKDGELPVSFTAGSTKLSDLIRIINDEDMGISAAYDAAMDRVFINTTDSGGQGVVKIKMDGIVDASGNVLTDTSGNCLSFFEDYLKMKVDVTTPNETAPANGIKITGENPLIIHSADNIKLNEMYASGTAPALIKFNLKGVTGEGTFTFSDLNITVKDMIAQINSEALHTGVTASFSADTGGVIFSTSGQVTISADTQNFLRDKLNMTIGSSQNTLTSNSALRVVDPNNIMMSELYVTGTVPTSVKFTLEGGQGNWKFSFAPGTTTIKNMLDTINNRQSTTGITAKYDGTTGKIVFFDSEPLAALTTGSTATTASLTFNEPLYGSSDGTSTGTLTALTDGQDVTARFALTGSGTLTSATYHIDPTTGKGRVDFVMAGAADGDSISIPAGLNNVFDVEGNRYQSPPLTYTAATTSWNYTSRLNTDRMLGIRYDDEGFLGDELNLSMYKKEGQKAIIDLNDAQNLEYDSNDITLFENLNLDLKNADPTKTITLTVKNDTDGAVKKIKAFVEVYNTTIVYMNTELTETRYNTPKTRKGGSGQYAPLTDAQKKDMSDDEIKNWETKAKSGMLRGDNILYSAYSTTRQAAMDPVNKKTATQPGLATDNPYTSMASIGINTLTYVQNSLEGGKLVIDEVKLKAALADNADQVKELFTLNEAVTDSAGQPVKDWNGDQKYIKGIAYRLYDAVNNNMTAITTKAGSSASTYDQSQLSKEIGRVNENITTLKNRVQTLTERYWAQFSAMEQMVNAYNSQMSWLTQQLGQMSGSSTSG